MLISAKALNQSNQKRTVFQSSHIVSFSFHLQDLQVSSNFGIGKPGNLGTTIQLMTQPRQALPRSKRKASEQAAPAATSSSLAANKALWIHGWGPMGVPSATHE